MTDPLGLPEPCDHPRLVLTCAECATTASWIIPHPMMRGLVLELAARSGWTGLTVGPCLCQACRSSEQAPKPAKAPSPIRRCEPFARVYSDELLAELWRRREAGQSWRKIACHAVWATGRDVTPSGISTVVLYHRRKAQRGTAGGQVMELQTRKAA